MTAAGKIHKALKTLLGRMPQLNCRLVTVPADLLENGQLPILEEDRFSFFNEAAAHPGCLKKEEIFPVENAVAPGTFARLPDSFAGRSKSTFRPAAPQEAPLLWREFLKASRIPDGYRYSPLSCAGYILEADEWCLPSWIWTNAAQVRTYLALGSPEEARQIADALMGLQAPDGGWIVRFDYDTAGPVPVLAPNDSAYIAKNACVEMYRATGEGKYLAAAEKCAGWIMTSARPDGMVYSGRDMKRGTWRKSNIVDVGFTSGLFAELYELTGREEYRRFLDRFLDRYTALFHAPRGGFYTALDENDRPLGGQFARGQAWALEGLIPADHLPGGENRRPLIDETCSRLVAMQDKDGAWPYNLTRRYLGTDCKAVSVIGLNLWQWWRLHPERDDCLKAALKALQWCKEHTAGEGGGRGGIFAWSAEGAVVHSPYTATAFVYAGAYALELETNIQRSGT